MHRFLVLLNERPVLLGWFMGCTAVLTGQVVFSLLK